MGNQIPQEKYLTVDRFREMIRLEWLKEHSNYTFRSLLLEVDDLINIGEKLRESFQHLECHKQVINPSVIFHDSRNDDMAWQVVPVRASMFVSIHKVTITHVVVTYSMQPDGEIRIWISDTDPNVFDAMLHVIVDMEAAYAQSILDAMR